MCEFQVRSGTDAAAFNMLHHPCGVHCAVSTPRDWVKAMAPALQWGIPILQLSMLAIGAIPGAPSLAKDITQAVIDGINMINSELMMAKNLLPSCYSAGDFDKSVRMSQEYVPSEDMLLLLQSKFPSIV